MSAEKEEAVVDYISMNRNQFHQRNHYTVFLGGQLIFRPANSYPLRLSKYYLISLNNTPEDILTQFFEENYFQKLSNLGK